MSDNRYLSKFGQNFLVNKDIIDSITSCFVFEPKAKILEIGPGDGVLTSCLVRYENFEAVEIDKFYSDKLQTKYPNLIVHNTSYKNVDFDSFDYIVGNIPYLYTSDIILKTIEASVKKAVFMIQSEAYERMFENKDKSNRSALIVLIQIFTKHERIVDAKPKDFKPAPRVNSTFFSFEVINSGGINIKRFYEFLLNLFKMKRKTLRNNMKSSYDFIDLEELFSLYNIDKNVRPEDLENKDIIDIYNYINKAYNDKR